MKNNKYLVVRANGEIASPRDYLKLSECPNDFAILIRREAMRVREDSRNAKSDYLKYAKKMGFSWEGHSDIGFISYDYKADLIMRLVKEYARKLVNEIGMPIYEVRGSNFFDMNYPVVKSYAGLFGERLFKHKSAKKELVMSYDASYPQFNLASSYSIREENLPMAHFSLSDCYRNEKSGECMLLFRGKRFFMPDLHPYLCDLERAFKWYFEIEKKILEAVKGLDRKYWNLAKVSSIGNWEKYNEKIIQIAKRKQEPMLVEIRRDSIDRYWIVDVDYSFIDKLDNVREVGCIQIDIGNAKRLGIEYFDVKGRKHNPIIIHAAVPGGIERYLYMLFDNFKESYPLWLHPVQLRLISVGDKYIKYCEEVVGENRDVPIRIEIDDRGESVAKRIKLAHEDLVPHHIVVGKKELQEKSIVEQKIQKIAEEVEDYPFLPFSWPVKMSKQIK